MEKTLSGSLGFGHRFSSGLPKLPIGIESMRTLKDLGYEVSLEARGSKTLFR